MAYVSGSAVSAAAASSTSDSPASASSSSSASSGSRNRDRTRLPTAVVMAPPQIKVQINVFRASHDSATKTMR